MTGLERSERRRNDLITLLVVVVVLVVDQITKHWALARFTGQPHHVIWTLEFSVARNTGAAFSLLSGRGIGPVVALVAVVVVVVVVRTLRFVSGRAAVLGSGMVIGGALGNLADRLLRAEGAGFLQGAVVDWINFQWWPVFNVADMAITVGALVLGISAVFTPSGEPEGDSSSA